jgi:hypothetical protein
VQIRRLAWIGIFALAMAFVEAAVVVYLRRVLGVVDLLRDVAVYDPAITLIEIGREAATLLMILAAGYATGSSLQSRLGFALYAFGLWDILYYVWLKVLLGWPASLLTEDVLFLIPLPWWGPVLAPVLVALISVTFGVLLVIRDATGRRVRLGWTEWMGVLAGMMVVIYTFMADAIGALPAGAEALSRLKPVGFLWPPFLGGLAAMAVSLWRAARRSTRPARS